ncbi:hypothetical protein O181_001753 [Austropuccinia psidii MF-1]|uniref:Integrase catalytic domain-containing protein n=1 Tax=Austropuccinia psidii MF-1 TaxID=1389203 RepID=A0A9Q3GC04_9BASI|nr:hypothetical protein [Austropuccinia psidii MF-1]
MKGPFQDTYLRTEQEKRSRPLFGGHCGRRMLQIIAGPVTDVKKQTNPLKKDLVISSKSKNPSDLGKLSIWIGYSSSGRNRVVSWTGIFTNIISDRGPKFTSALWKNLHQVSGPKLSFSTAYHPQTDGLSERIIQTLEDMVGIFCAYGLKFKYCDGLTHYWCTLLPALELAYKTSIHSSTNQTPAVLEKGLNPRLPQDSLRKELVELHPTASSFKGMLDKARKHVVRCMEDSFAYSKDKWDKSHATPDFKVGDLVLVSTTNLNKIKGCKKLKESFAGPFVIKALHGENAVEV